jgi:hypothetical protein
VEELKKALEAHGHEDALDECESLLFSSLFDQRIRKLICSGRHGRIR